MSNTFEQMKQHTPDTLKYLDKGMDIFASSKIFSRIDEWNVSVLEKREKDLLKLLTEKPF